MDYVPNRDMDYKPQTMQEGGVTNDKKKEREERRKARREARSMRPNLIERVGHSLERRRLKKKARKKGLKFDNGGSCPVYKDDKERIEKRHNLKTVDKDISKEDLKKLKEKLGNKKRGGVPKKKTKFIFD